VGVRIDFNWDSAKAASNASKHGVTFEEALTVFRDPLALSMLDSAPNPDEERWVTLGEGSTGKLLVVVHSWLDIELDRSVVRIISARQPTRSEARQYREGPMP
jgi:uncharacterized DUF497 family protein